MSIIVLSDPPYMQQRLMRIDGVGIILLAVGLTALQIFLERGEREQWFESTFMVVTAVVAGVTLVALVVWELYVEDPVINFRLLKNVPFTAGSCLGAIFGVTPYNVGTAQRLDGLTGRLAAANACLPAWLRIARSSSSMAR